MFRKLDASQPTGYRNRPGFLNTRFPLASSPLSLFFPRCRFGLGSLFLITFNHDDTQKTAHNDRAEEN